MSSYFYKLAAYAVSNINLGFILIILHPSSHFCLLPYLIILLIVMSQPSGVLVSVHSFLFCFVFWLPVFIFLLSILPSYIITFIPISPPPPELFHLLTLLACTFRLSPILLHVLFLLPSSAFHSVIMWLVHQIKMPRRKVRNVDV